MGLTTALHLAVSANRTSSVTDSDNRLFKDGDKVGTWRVVALLGKGGNGEVYRVEHLENGVVGALKAPPKNDLCLRARFDRELEILRKVAPKPKKFWRVFSIFGKDGEASRYFPHILDWNEDTAHDVPYLVTEYLQEIKELPSKDSEVRKYILGVSSAIRELHKHGYLHRDVKPENVMRRESGDIVLIDFGLAIRIKDADNPISCRISIQHGKACGVGTEGFSAPEQLFGHATIRSDIYPLGQLANACFRHNPPATWLPLINKATCGREECRHSDVDEFIRAVKKSAPWRRWTIRLLLITIVCLVAYPWFCITLDTVNDNREKARQTQDELEHEASRLRHKAAELGDVDAQYQVGLRYKNGDGTKKDLPKAVMWFRKAAEKGNALAQRELVFRPKSALHMLCKEAERGDGDAQCEFARCYSLGCGVARNQNEAMNWYRKAAAQGHEDACRIVDEWQQAEVSNRVDKVKLAAQTIDANRVTKDKHLHKNAQLITPEKLDAERMNKSVDPEIAAEKALADAKKIRPQDEIAHQGNTLPNEETQKAIELFKKSDWQVGLTHAEMADREDPELLLWLGICYDIGLGNNCDAQKATAYFRRAAEKGQIDAQCELGRSYETGRGVSKDLTQAKRWYQAAASQGSKNAILALHRLDAQDDSTSGGTSLRQRRKARAETAKPIREAEHPNPTFQENRWLKISSRHMCA